MTDEPLRDDPTPGLEDTPPPFRRTESLPTAPRPPRRGPGCWLPALLTLFLVGALVLVGAVLPPVNLLQRVFGLSLFGPSYVPLSAQANATALDGLAVVADPAALTQPFGVALAAVPLAATTTDNAEIAQALAAVPPTLSRQSAVYDIQTSGVTPDGLALTLTLPPNADPDRVDLYGWYAEDERWRFVPAQLNTQGALALVATPDELPQQIALFQDAGARQPVVLVAVDPAQVLSAEAASIATIVAPGGMTPTLDGALTGSLAPGYDLTQGYWVMPVIRNFADPRAVDSATVAAILGNRTLRSLHAAQITGFASNNGFRGAFVDYRDVAPELREQYSAFIRELGADMRAQGLQFGVVLPEAVNNAGVWETGAYNWRVIGAEADFIQVNLSLNPETFEPGIDRPVEALLRWATGEVSRSKLMLGLSALSVREAAGAFTSIGYDEALSALGDVRIESEVAPGGTVPPQAEIRAGLDGFRAVGGLNESVQTPFVDYLAVDESRVSRVWLTTPGALRFRMERTLALGLGGVAFEDLLARDVAAGVAQSILDYKLQAPQTAAPSALALRWRIQGAGGIISEVTTALDEALAVTLDAPEGNYAINLDVVGGQDASPRSGVAVALFAPTPSPTPLPTPTPTPVPTATPAPAVVLQAPANNAPAARPGAGSISVGQFEYGGHVTSTNSDRAADAMRRAGMTWMKVQLRYTPGMSPGVAQPIIADAKGRGFKILLGVVGYPQDVAAGGAAYFGQFASFVGGVAGLGPDAIEIWNEPNLDREWPEGRISGVTYTELLRQSYQAIKSANGGVKVISGAPAPTGAEAAFPGRVMNDDRFLREMVDAGAMQYMDCLGVHYNEGIVPPTATSGDPRDNFYSRYLPSMVDLYWNTTGGQRPLCFTELGYLTPEGFGPLDSFFAWGQNTTVAQQSAWLAGAAAYLSQTGRTQLMIVWNVDFTNYGADPMAGFAMIRPDGGCPACDALAGAR